MEQDLAGGWAELLRKVMTDWGLASARGKLLPGEETLYFRLSAYCNPYFIFHCKFVGIQDGKGTFQKWIQNIYDQSVNLSWVINYISVQERKITYNLMINERQFFFFGRFVSKVIVQIKS